MKAVLQLFWQMCLLRQSPEYVPTQTWFVATVIGANIVCSLLLSLLVDSQMDFLAGLTQLVVAQTTTAALVWLALFLRERINRFPATVTALFGCDLIITVCFVVVLPLTSSLGQAASSFTYLCFLVWSLSVMGFILRRALGVPLAIGILLAIGTTVLSVSLSKVAIGAA